MHIGGGSCGHDHGHGQKHGEEKKDAEKKEEEKTEAASIMEEGDEEKPLIKKSEPEGGCSHDHDHAHAHQKEPRQNLNIDAAYLHVLGDMLMSVAVLLASVIIYFKPTWTLADPICTYIFSIIVLFTVGEVI